MSNCSLLVPLLVGEGFELPSQLALLWTLYCHKLISEIWVQRRFDSLLFTVRLVSNYIGIPKILYCCRRRLAQVLLESSCRAEKFIFQLKPWLLDLMVLKLFCLLMSSVERYVQKQLWTIPNTPTHNFASRTGRHRFIYSVLTSKNVNKSAGQLNSLLIVPTQPQPIFSGCYTQIVLLILQRMTTIICRTFHLLKNTKARNCKLISIRVRSLPFLSNWRQFFVRLSSYWW